MCALVQLRPSHSEMHATPSKPNPIEVAMVLAFVVSTGLVRDLVAAVLMQLRPGRSEAHVTASTPNPM